MRQAILNLELRAVILAMALAAVIATLLAASGAQAQSSVIDYDTDDDGLIEVSTLLQLDAIRWDLNGDGVPQNEGGTTPGPERHWYVGAGAFENPAPNMGCPGTPTPPLGVCRGYELTADLDFDTDGDGRTDVAGDTFWNNGQGWNPIGDAENTLNYLAEFNGNGHVIKNLYINRSGNRLGLFTALSTDRAYVHHVGLPNVNVNGNGSNDVGSLVGIIYSGSKVARSFATGSVIVTGGDNDLWRVGGLVGQNNNSYVSASYTDVRVHAPGSKEVGGVVGFTNGRVSAVYATGPVTPSRDRTHGAVGWTANDGHLDFSYYDKSIGKTDKWLKTPRELQEPTGYTGIYADWRTYRDVQRVPDDPWDFGTASQYPILKGFDSYSQRRGAGPMTHFKALADGSQHSTISLRGDRSLTLYWTTNGLGRQTAAPAVITGPDGEVVAGCVTGSSSWTERECTITVPIDHLPGTYTFTLRSPHWATALIWVEVTGIDYDYDDNNLIDIGNLAQLNAVRWDLDGNGSPEWGGDGYDDAFPGRSPGMGCPDGCAGYELIADLDFDTNGNGRADAGDAYWRGGRGWDPIDRRGGGYGNYPYLKFDGWYSAEFNGNGHTISNLYINGWEVHRTKPGDARGPRLGASWDRELLFYVGLFGYVNGKNAHIHHVGLPNAYVHERQWNGYCNWNWQVDKPQDCFTAPGESRSRGGKYVGALVGGLDNKARVTNSWSTGFVRGHYATGGLVGLVKKATVSASWTDTLVMGYADSGGLVGHNHAGTVQASYARGTLMHSPDHLNTHHGVLGWTANGGKHPDIYYDSTRHPVDKAPFSRSTADLKTPTGYAGVYANWNVDVDGDGTADDPWDFGSSSDYPSLKADRNGDGRAFKIEFGNQRNPPGVPNQTVDYDTDDDGLIEIGSLQQLNLIRLDLDGNGFHDDAGGWAVPIFKGGIYNMGCPSWCKGYELTADLDFDTNGNGAADAGDQFWNDDDGWLPIGFGHGKFTAEFNGNGHSISNLFIARWGGNEIGLFGWVAEPGFVHHLSLPNVSVANWNPESQNTGGAIGRLGDKATAASIYVSGRVTGGNNTGGVLGYSYGYAPAIYSNAVVSGNANVGGLIGHNDGGVYASYAFGSVSGNEKVHGALGKNTRSSHAVRSVYYQAVGDVAEDSFDRTAAQLRTPTDYEGIYAGWNVDTSSGWNQSTNKAGDGNRPWDFGTSGDYPKLTADRDGDGTATSDEFSGQDHSGTAPPAVISVEMVSDPGEDDTYAAGDLIRVSVTFSKPVTVAGTPTLALDIGGTTVSAVYRPNSQWSAGAGMAFGWDVSAGSIDEDGISIAANSLALGGGTIRDAAGNNANLGHPPIPDDPGHRVRAIGGQDTGNDDAGNGNDDAGDDDTSPTVVSFEIVSDPGDDDTYGVGDLIRVTVTFNENVVVTERPALTLDIGGTAVLAEYKPNSRWSQGSVMAFAVRVTAGLSDQDGISIGANSIALGAGGAIRDAAGNCANLSHAAVPDDTEHKVSAPGGL